MKRPVIRDWQNPPYEEVWAFRNWNLARLRAGGQGAWDAAWAYYSTHPCEAIGDWVTTYDPRLAGLGRPAYVPFVLFPRQRDFVRWLYDLYTGQREGVVEKSRDCGATWLTVAFSWWLWTFHEGVQVGFGSRKEGLVDKIGDPDSIFQKFRIVLERLPVELRPIGFRADQDCPHMRIKNRETGSVIIGQGGRNIGRGGRATMYFIDEAAFLDHPEDAEAALSANADAKAWISTPGRAGDLFYRKRFSGRLPVFTFHWRDDLRKDGEWYAEKQKTLEPEVLAREVDLDYHAGDDDVAVPAAWVRASRDLRKLLEENGELEESSEYEGIAGLDVAGGGKAKNVHIVRHGPIVDKPSAWSDADSIDIATDARNATIRAGARKLNFDAVGVGKGVASALKRMPGVHSQGVTAGGRPSRARWPDGLRANKKFANLKAELWWEMRDRLRRTFEEWLYRQDPDTGVHHDIDELLLLPTDEQLCSQLSLPKYTARSGKTAIESKDQLRSRGVPSPDYAEALSMTFAPRVKRKTSNRVRGLW